MSFELIDYEVTDHTAELTMHRDPVNAINHDLTEEVGFAAGRTRERRPADGTGHLGRGLPEDCLFVLAVRTLDFVESS